MLPLDPGGLLRVDFRVDLPHLPSVTCGSWTEP
jgi:hypothetical protein